jgi:predicted alpha/beta-hydrolase family hydrolase
MLRYASERREGRRLFAGGKSMGGRIASMLAAEQGERFPAQALVFFGYPRHPPGRTASLRDAHLQRIQLPMLFIQGTRDALARLGLLEAVVETLTRISWKVRTMASASRASSALMRRRVAPWPPSPRTIFNRL